MKKIVFALATLAIVSCKKEDVKPVDYTLFTGKVINKEGDKLMIYKGQNLKKEITLDENGVFADTLRLEAGEYVALAGNQYAKVYVKNGQHFNMNVDAEDFNTSLAFTGEGAKANELFAKLTLLQENLDYETLISGDKAGFDTGIDSFKKEYLETLNSSKDLLDSVTVANQSKSLEGMSAQLAKMFTAKNKMKALVGTPSPSFENYENFKGGKTSLADLKGKYVYIDLWATWCGPCKKEIPSLKEVEAKYHGKNIEFVSISLDNGRGYKGDTKEAKAIAAHEGWQKMVADKELTGIQLFADNGFASTFSREYNVNSIPRFLLLDPKGNIIDADAPRPSSPKLIEVLTAQGL